MCMYNFSSVQNKTSTSSQGYFQRMLQGSLINPHPKTFVIYSPLQTPADTQYRGRAAGHLGPASVVALNVYLSNQAGTPAFLPWVVIGYSECHSLIESNPCICLYNNQLVARLPHLHHDVHTCNDLISCTPCMSCSVVLQKVLGQPLHRDHVIVHAAFSLLDAWVCVHALS